MTALLSRSWPATENGTYPGPVLAARRCGECGDDVSVCAECQHPHDWYDHVGPNEHMCSWCLQSDYDNDPLGLPGHLR